MATIIHERPGVYSSYDASAVIRSGRSVRVIGVAAKSVSGTANAPVTLTSYEGGISAFGEDAAGSPGMSTILRLLFLNGAATVAATAVSGEDYEAAFAALAAVENVQVVVCDSGDLAVQQKLRESVESASALRRERIAVVGMSGAAPAALTERAAALNSERMVLVGPDVVTSGGDSLSGVFAAAAAAGAVEAFGESEPVATINGQNKYVLELTRLYATDDAISDGIDFFALADFSLVICKPDRKVIYSGCQWSAIQEEGKVGAMVAEKVTLMATSRIEVAA